MCHIASEGVCCSFFEFMVVCAGICVDYYLFMGSDTGFTHDSKGKTSSSTHISNPKKT